MDLSLISVTICEFSGVLNSHGCLSKYLLSDLNILHDNTNRTNERTHAQSIFSTPQQPSLYSICLQPRICQSHQLHNLFWSMRLHFSYHHTRKPTNALYILPVSDSVSFQLKKPQSLCALPAGRVEADGTQKNGPSMTCLCRFAPHVVCTQCSFWPLISRVDSWDEKPLRNKYCYCPNTYLLLLL